MTTTAQTLWGWPNLCSALGLSRRQYAQLRERTDGPKPVKQENGQDLFDSEELIAWVTRVRPGLKR